MPREYPPRSRRPAAGRRPNRRSPWWLLVLILVLGSGGWYWIQFRRTSPPVKRQPASPPAPVRRPPSPVAEPSPPVSPTPPRTLPEPAPRTNLPVVSAPQIPAVPAPAIKPPPNSRVREDPTPFVRRPAMDMLEAQIALDQLGFGTGPLDGVGGSQTALALKAFQYQHGLEETGRRDQDTDRVLLLSRAPIRRFTVSAEDLSRLHPVPATWLGKSEVSRLDYESLVELVAEKSHAHPNLIRRLNPGVDWNSVAPGTQLMVPEAEYPAPRRAALIRISLAGRYLRAYDERGNLLAHFPVSIGRVAEKRPVGALSVIVAVKDPNYTFDPAVFPESAEGRQLGRRLVIPPGPNNPVGVAWIGLSRPGYGIHGTPAPEQVGRTESHGCFRLANWNADHLRQMVGVGTPVRVEP